MVFSFKKTKYSKIWRILKILPQAQTLVPTALLSKPSFQKNVLVNKKKKKLQTRYSKTSKFSLKT